MSTCEETLIDISTNVITLINEIASIKLKVAKLDYLVDSSNNISIPSNDVDLSKIHSALGINPPDSGESSLFTLIKEKIDSIDYAPNITVDTTDLTVSAPTVNIDLSTVNTKLDNLQVDSTKTVNFIGV